MELPDLPPKNDVKGGSPKSPAYGIPISEFEQSPPPKFNGLLGSLVKYFITFLCGGFSAAFFLGGKSRDISDLLMFKGKIEEMHLETQKLQMELNTSEIHELYNKVEPIGAMKEHIESLQRQMDSKK